MIVEKKISKVVDVMVNVLRQYKLYYPIVKELQLFNPKEFGNIFFELVGFHMEKLAIACCGRHLEDFGADVILKGCEAFGSGVVKLVFSGSHYVRGKRVMGILSEAMQRLLLTEFSTNQNAQGSQETIKCNISIGGCR